MTREQSPVVLVTKEITIDSAHHLEDYDGKCANVHGHTYRIQVTARGIVDSKTQMVVDFSDLKRVMDEFITQRFDHCDLNEAGKTLQ